MSNRVAPLSGNDMSDEVGPSPPPLQQPSTDDGRLPKSRQLYLDLDVPTASQDSFTFKKCCSCSQQRVTQPKFRRQVVAVAILGFIVQHFGIVLDDFHMAQVHNFIIGGIVSHPPFGTTFLLVVAGLSLLTRNFCISANVILYFRVKKTKWACLQRIMDKFPCPFVFWSVSHWFLYMFNLLQILLSVGWLTLLVDHPDWSCARARNKTGSNGTTGGPYLAIYIPAIPLAEEGGHVLGILMLCAIMWLFIIIILQVQLRVFVTQYDILVHWKGEVISEENEGHHPADDPDPDSGQLRGAEVIQVQPQPSSAIVNEKKP